MKLNVRHGLIVAFAVVLCAAIPAKAEIYLETNPQILGESTAPGFEDQIPVSSGQWGVGRGGCSGTGGSISLSEFTFTTELSRATAGLASALRDGTVYSTFTFRYTVNLGAAGVRTYQSLTFINAFVTGYSQSSGGDRPAESYSINFSKVDIVYDMFDQNGKSLGATTTAIINPSCP